MSIFPWPSKAERRAHIDTASAERERAEQNRDEAQEVIDQVRAAGVDALTAATALNDVLDDIRRGL